jgi:hypothetical protein
MRGNINKQEEIKYSIYQINKVNVKYIILCFTPHSPTERGGGVLSPEEGTSLLSSLLLW